jgi:hypothetical protein
MRYAKHWILRQDFVFRSEDIFTFQLTTYIELFKGGLSCLKN